MKRKPKFCNYLERRIRVQKGLPVPKRKSPARTGRGQVIGKVVIPAKPKLAKEENLGEL